MKNFFGNATRWLRYALVLLCCLSGVAVGLPAGGIISVGTGSIAGSGVAMTITSDAPGTVIDWTSFSIGANETVSIVQPSSTSTVLLRASGIYPTQMLGTLQSNGRVYLANPAGVQIGASAVADAAGLLLSTLDLSDQNFLANQLQFASSVGSGVLANAGSLSAAPGGSVYLVSPSIDNSGTVNAPQGGILLAAGNTVVDLTTPGKPIIADATGTAVSRAANRGQLFAHDGKIGVYAGAIYQNGTVSADAAVSNVGGTIVISSTMITRVSVNSVVSAKGAQGGNITFNSLGTLALDGVFDTSIGGWLSIDPTNLTVAGAGTTTAPDPVVGTITAANSGTNIGTVTLGALNQTYNGSVPSATCATVPANLSISISYNDIGSGPLSRNVGNYGATCTVTQPGYSGSVSGTLVISPLSLNIYVASGVHVYDATVASGVLSNSGLAGTTLVTNTGAGSLSTSGVSVTSIDGNYVVSNYGAGGLVNSNSGGTLTITSTTCMTCKVYDATPAGSLASNNTAIGLLA